ncbi:MAG TPA: type II toxin-antitoxin system RelE/ParE family toxin [Myxococcales bacterium]|jgi:plasmid stabilization system protein ParE
MPRVEYSPRALAHAEKLVEFLRETDPRAAEGTWALIESAVNTLREHPFIGRALDQGLRELVISRGKSGHLALYGYAEEADRVVVLALRHQREAGYE